MKTAKNGGGSLSEVKWIKIVTNVFDNRKIRMIEKMPEGDAIIVIWFKVLCLAGTINDNGLILFTPDIAYTEEMLASQFDRPLSTVRLAFQTFLKFGMIEIVDNILCISNWEKYQNIEGMDKIREQNRLRKRRERERKKLGTELSNSDSHVTVTQCHAIEEDKEEELELDRDYLVKVPYQKVVDLWNQTTEGLPKVKALSSARRSAIKRIWSETNGSLEQIEKVFQQVQSSDFLTGRSGGWTGCGFDWVVKPANWLKIIEGNYQNKGGGSVVTQYKCAD